MNDKNDKEDMKKDKKKQSESFSTEKKSGFDMREHLTLKNDTLQAEIYKNKKKKGVQPLSQKTIKNLPVGVQKMRKKIRDIYDEDDEEDIYNYTFIKAPRIEEENKNPTEELKSEAEKKAQKQQENNNIIKAQQTAGKMEALEVANHLAREVGLKGLKKQTVNKGMQEAVFRPKETYTKAIEKDVSKELGIKGKVKDKEIIQAVRGIKTVESLGTKKAVKNLDMSDMVKVGEKKMDQKELAELILKKSGQDITKYHQKNQKEQDVKLKSLESNKKDSKEKEKNESQDFKKTLSPKGHEFGR